MYHLLTTNLFRVHHRLWTEVLMTLLQLKAGIPEDSIEFQRLTVNPIGLNFSLKEGEVDGIQLKVAFIEGVNETACRLVVGDVGTANLAVIGKISSNLGVVRDFFGGGVAHCWYWVRDFVLRLEGGGCQDDADSWWQ